MPQLNFAFQDIPGSLLACILFPFIIVFPGYVIAWGLDLLGFKKRGHLARFAIAMVISFSVSPILLFLLWRLASFQWALAVFLAFFVAFIFLALNSVRKTGLSLRSEYTSTIFWVAFLWIGLTLLSLADIQIGNRLYFSVVSIDYTTRVALTEAVARTGVPPINPSFFPGQPVQLTDLYYLLYVMSGMIEKIGMPWVNGHDAMLASVVWDGFGMMALIALYLQLRAPGSPTNTRRLTLLGVASLTIGGLDVIPHLLLHIPLRIVTGKFVFDGVIEHWNEKIDTWLTSFFWDPHHIASLIACTTAFLLLQYVYDRPRREQVGAMLVAGAAFASALGLSVYVTIVFCVFWAVWFLILAFQKKRYFLAIWMVVSGFLALSLAFPFMRDLLGGMSSAEAGSFPLAFNVRNFLYAMPLISNLSVFWQNVILLALLPLNYFLELGFFFWAGILWIRHQRKDTTLGQVHRQAEIVLLCTAALLATFVKSTVISNNDFGWRAWLPGQFILLIWGAELLFNYLYEQGFPKSTLDKLKSIEQRSSLLAFCLILGLLTTLLNAFYLRSWPLFIDAGLTNAQFLSADTHLGEHTFAARQVYDFINSHFADNLIIQTNPTTPLNFPLGLYSHRQTVISGITAYGVPAATYSNMVDQIKPIFLSTDQRSWQNIDSICKKTSINILVVNDLDPLWSSLPGLEISRTAAFKNDYYAVFTCGNSATN